MISSKNLEIMYFHPGYHWLKVYFLTQASLAYYLRKLLPN